MKWCRYTPVDTPYHVGAVVIIKPVVQKADECELILVTKVMTDEAEGWRFLSGKKALLGPACTEISSLVPPEFWSDDICLAVATWRLTNGSA